MTTEVPSQDLEVRPRVSVLMIAYNVEKFISVALDSVLMQEVDFEYEIVIGEDCSTDGTREIIADYTNGHPRRIRAVFRQQNLGMNENFVATLRECRGEYVALLDADDYWTRTDKLRKQVDFLTSHPEYSIAFHNTLVVYEDDEVETHPFHLEKPKYRLSRSIPKTTSTERDLVTGNFMQTCSVMFRSGLIGDLPDWFLDFPTFDWPLHLLNSVRGPIKYMDEIMGAYRVHRNGIWSMNMSRYDKPEDLERMISAYLRVNQHFDYKYDVPIRERLVSLYYRIAQLFSDSKKHEEAGYYARKALLTLPLRYRVERRYRERQKHLIKIMIKALFGQFQGRLRTYR